MFYIHTFSMIRYIEKDEIDALRNSYEDHFFFISDEATWVLNAFLDHGLRVEISPIPSDNGVRRFNRNHPCYKAILFITPAKLLNPGINLGGLTSRIDISDACYHLERIMASIENESGINLMTGAVLSRVDVTKDVIMPSDLYSRELIRAAKKSINKHGYNLYSPSTHHDFRVEWRDEDTMMFQNKNQHIAAKIYNKKRGLELNNCLTEVKDLGNRGLLRFELSLYAQRIKADYQTDGGNDVDQLSDVLWAITEDAPQLFHRHFVQVFFPGKMVSRSELKKSIKRECPDKRKRPKGMLAFSSDLSQNGVISSKKIYTEREFSTRLMWFRDLGVSPVCVCKECSTIPSFSMLLAQKNTG